MDGYSLRTVIKSAAIAPLVVPFCALIYLLFAPVSMGAVYAGEATVMALVMGLALTFAYALFVLAVLPPYLALARKGHLRYGSMSFGSAILGGLNVLLAAYLLSSSGTKLATIDVVVVGGGVVAAAISIANVFIYLAQRYQGQERADV